MRKLRVCVAGPPGFHWGQLDSVAAERRQLPKIDRLGSQSRDPALVRLFLPGSGKLLEVKVEQLGPEAGLRTALDWAAPAQWRSPPPAGYCLRQRGTNHCSCGQQHPGLANCGACS